MAKVFDLFVKSSIQNNKKLGILAVLSLLFGLSLIASSITDFKSAVEEKNEIREIRDKKSIYRNNTEAKIKLLKLDSMDNCGFLNVPAINEEQVLEELFSKFEGLASLLQFSDGGGALSGTIQSVISIWFIYQIRKSPNANVLKTNAKRWLRVNILVLLPIMMSFGGVAVSGVHRNTQVGISGTNFFTHNLILFLANKVIRNIQNSDEEKPEKDSKEKKDEKEEEIGKVENIELEEIVEKP